jgi:hypothetical protein
MFSIIFASLKCHADDMVQIHPSGVENKKTVAIPRDAPPGLSRGLTQTPTPPGSPTSNNLQQNIYVTPGSPTSRILLSYDILSTTELSVSDNTNIHLLQNYHQIYNNIYVTPGSPTSRILLSYDILSTTELSASDNTNIHLLQNYHQIYNNIYVTPGSPTSRILLSYDILSTTELSVNDDTYTAELPYIHQQQTTL